MSRQRPRERIAGHLAARFGQRRRVEAGDEGPLARLLFQPALHLLQRAPGRAAVEESVGVGGGILGQRLGRVGAQVLLAQGLEPLPLRAGGAEELAGQRHRFVELRARR
jgi:hypothetical protein